ncbi:hypothetical protein BC332_13962 [Capsicum chinense]|nr:hypothetical protein BC332_13962 [Capsicum chinense]
MTIPVVQIQPITPESSTNDTLVEKIKARKVKEMTLSHYISVEGEKKGEDEKTPQRTLVFNRIGKSTLRVSVFDRLGGKDGNGASNCVEGHVTTANTSIFLCLGTTEKSSSRKMLLGHEQQYFSKDIDDKEIHSSFPSRIKIKSILLITTDGSLKVRKRTIIFTNQHLGETKEDPEEASASYNITVEDNLCHDEMDNDVQEAPPQLKDGVQSTVDELKEINLGTLENPRPTFVSTLLTPQ